MKKLTLKQRQLVKEYAKKLVENRISETIIRLGEDDYKIKKVDFKFLNTLSKKGFEGICFLGTGGELKQWINGINDLLNQEGVGTGTVQDKFSGVYQTSTSGDRTDLILIFKNKSNAVNIGKMAMWRLRFGDTSWLSDYVVNYRDQHSGYEGMNETKIGPGGHNPGQGYTIIITRRDKNKPISGTLDYFIDYFSYTLEKGNSWDKKVIKDPNKLMKMSIDKFVDNLNRAKDAATGNGYDASTEYSVG